MFCDISTPKKRKGAGLPGETGFSVYDDIRRKLIAGGIPPEQIAFVHDADTEVKKRDLFAKVRSGQVRVLMGSTSLMGAGTNVQTHAIALHDLDCPWRPRDLTQRKGRIERQGNQNKTVHVYRYVTEATFDAYLWQTVEAKQRFISQVMTSRSPVRSCEDVDEAALSYAEIKAICAGDPRIKEKMDLDVEVSRLKLMKSDHQSRQFRLEDQVLKYFPEQIAHEQDTIRKLKADIETLSLNPVPAEGFVGLEAQGQAYTDKEKAGEALLKAIEENAGVVPTKIGSYRGFALYTYMDALWDCPVIRLEGQSVYRIDAGSDARGNLTRIDNELARLPDRLAAATRQLGNLRRQRNAARAEIGKDFPYEKELSEKTARLALLNLQLDLDSKKENSPEEDGGMRSQKQPRRAWSWDAGKEGTKKRTKKRSIAR
ncbi:MAG: helicase [Abditibacteriota bacterium]|nr:helicase [Abditibacteriota bacterium]